MTAGRFTNRGTASFLAAVLLGALGAAAGTAFAETGSDGELSCTYQLQQNAGKVTGSCEGGTEMGSASGTFVGHLRQSGVGSGSFDLVLPTGTYSGTFKGKPFSGGPAKGTWSIEAGSVDLAGTFVAVPA